MLRKWRRRSKRLIAKARREAPKVKLRVVETVSDLYPSRVTRSMQKLFEQTKKFIIIEVYRCMPLLGDEEKQAPDWTVHIVRYDVVYVD